MEYPFEAGIWYPDGDITTNKFVHYFRVIFTMWLPAYLVDFLCVLTRRKRILVKLQGKISQGLHLLQYFSNRKWDFRAEKAKLASQYLTEEDQRIFLTILDDIDVPNYIKDCILGGRQFCLKEPLSTLPKARAQLKM